MQHESENNKGIFENIKCHVTRGTYLPLHQPLLTVKAFGQLVSF